MCILMTALLYNLTTWSWRIAIERDREIIEGYYLFC
jgi:hypothetical protein